MLCVVLPGLSRAQPARDPQPTLVPAAHSAAALVRQLNDADPQLRHAASLELNNLSGDALPVVEAAMRDEPPSAESRLRLQDAVRILRPRATRERRYRERAAWERQTLLDAYRQHGETDRAYDPLAEHALELFLDLEPAPLHGPPEPRERALAAFKAATDKGCRDPLLLCLYHVTVGENFEDGHSPAPSRFTRALQQVMSGDYPPAVKFLCLCRYELADQRTPDGKSDPAGDMLKAIAQTKDLPDGELDASALRYFSAVSAHGGDLPWLRLAPFIDCYAQLSPGKPGPLVLRALGLVDAARQARGTAPAERLDPAAAKAFQDHLDDAQHTLLDAWALDPTDPRAPTAMLRVILARPDADGARDNVETWFKRSTDLDPDDYQAYALKLRFLDAVESDRGREMLEFGRECLATHNWRAGIPHLLVAAHDALAQRSGDSSTYYARPDVWQDLRDVYEGSLLSFPNNAHHRTQYAKSAARSGRWGVAHKQFQILGDRADVSVFGGNPASLDYLRDKAARLAAAP